MSQCVPTEHIVGTIAGRLVRQSEWSAAMETYARKVVAFDNQRGHDAAPFPGFVSQCNYCPECGAPLYGLSLRTLADALTAVEAGAAAAAPSGKKNSEATEPQTIIEFEGGGNFITARAASGDVLIRCNFEYTDCRETEPLDDFVARHGGAEATAEYLKQCYRVW